MTDANGYFFTRGLKPGQAYNLTAEATQDGKQLLGTMQTKVPNPVITIVLREDDGLPPVGRTRPAGGTRGDDFPPPPAESENIPPRGSRYAAHAATDARRLVASLPATARPGPSPRRSAHRPPWSPPVGPIGPPDDLSNPVPSRPENVAGGERSPFNPPAVSIPGPPGAAAVRCPILVLPKRPRSQAGRRVPGRTSTWSTRWSGTGSSPADRSGSVVLLEFITTSCPNCKPAVPVLRDLQSRYAADGLQVIAVMCDEAPLASGRAAAAATYARDNNTNYAVYVEPGPQPGAVRDRFNVEGYPTAVLARRLAAR